MADTVFYLAQHDGSHEAVETHAADATHAEVGAPEGAGHGEGHGGGGPINSEPNLSIYTGIAFVIVLYGLSRLVPHLLKALDERSEKIAGDLQSAEDAKTDAEKLQAQYQQQLTDARGEARQIIDEARTQAETQARGIVAAAQEDAAGLKQKAQEEIEADKARAVKDLRSDIADLSCSVASRLLDETVSADAHKALIDRFIDEIGSDDGRRN